MSLNNFIPLEISDEEILVRFIFESDFKNKKVESSKIISQEVFLDTRGGVSMQRHDYCSENECKKFALKIPNKQFVGFVIFEKKAFDIVVENHKNERDTFEAIIEHTPMDSEFKYLAPLTRVSTNSPGNPSHCDLKYINPAVINDETPKTAIRIFSRKLFKKSKLIFESLNPEEYIGNTFISELSNFLIESQE